MKITFTPTSKTGRKRNPVTVEVDSVRFGDAFTVLSGVWFSGIKAVIEIGQKWNPCIGRDGRGNILFESKKAEKPITEEIRKRELGF